MNWTDKAIRAKEQQLQAFDYRSLGWANGWTDEPIDRINCHEACHKCDWASNHERCQTLVWCERCKYFYWVDSSD